MEVVSQEGSCLNCGVTFTNILEHLQMYHSGEEVMVNMSICFSTRRIQSVFTDSQFCYVYGSFKYKLQYFNTDVLLIYKTQMECLIVIFFLHLASVNKNTFSSSDSELKLAIFSSLKISAILLTSSMMKASILLW